MTTSPGADTTACPICASPVKATLETRWLSLRRCRQCGHTVAGHQPSSTTSVDYHDQYPEKFTIALERTRIRQARLIASMLRKLGILDRLVDFGCGRGWFLTECRKTGMAPVAGLDTSAKATSLLRDDGLEAHLLPIPDNAPWQIPVSQLSFRAEVVTFLDVIEHFPGGRVRDMFRTVIDSFAPDINWIVVKVPVSDGLLYRAAWAMARAGISGPLHQLYQVGTFPPHFHYFSRRSLRTLVESEGFDIDNEAGDVDFDVHGFEHRVATLRRLPAFIGRIAGFALWLAATITRRFDSRIVVARKRHFTVVRE